MSMFCAKELTNRAQHGVAADLSLGSQQPLSLLLVM